MNLHFPCEMHRDQQSETAENRILFFRTDVAFPTRPQ